MLLLNTLQLLNYNCNVHKSTYFWNGNESENPFLISNLTKNDDFFEKTGKKSPFLVKNSWTAYKTF